MRAPIALILTILLSLPALALAADCVTDISADEAYELMEDGAHHPLVLDVRTPGEFRGRGGHLPGAILVPLGELEQHLAELGKVRDREVIVVCRSGNRSAIASRILCDAGFTEVMNLAGGLIAWQRSGLPVETE